MPQINRVEFKKSEDLRINGKNTSGMLVTFSGEPEAIAKIKEASDGKAGIGLHSSAADGTQMKLAFDGKGEIGRANDQAIYFVNQLSKAGDISFAQTNLMIQQNARAAATASLKDWSL